MEVTRNSETAQHMAPKFCMHIPCDCAGHGLGLMSIGFIIWKKIGILKQSFGLCSLPQQMVGRSPARSDSAAVAARLQCCISSSAACIMYSLPQADRKADV